MYASINLSLCVLETLAQTPPSLRTALPELAAVRIEIPDNAGSRDVERDELPDDFDAAVTRVRCREIGDAWLAEGDQLALIVPSIIVPQERNVIINPTHPLMADVKIISIERFRFDARLAAPPIA